MVIVAEVVEVQVVEGQVMEDEVMEGEEEMIMVTEVMMTVGEDSILS